MKRFVLAANRGITMNAIQRILGVVVVAAMFSAPASALAIGTDYEKPPAPGPDWWTPDLQKLVLNEHWVHGYLINAEDKHFFAGSTEGLNKFLQEYSRLDQARLEIVLHEGTKQAASPWNESGKGPQADWALYTAPRDWLKTSPHTRVTDSDAPIITKIDIWLGGNIDVDDLKIPVPAGITVTTGKDFQADGVLRIQRGGRQGSPAVQLENRLKAIRQRAEGARQQE